MADIATIQKMTAQLYDALIGKVIKKTPLTERENTAYHALDLSIRLETGSYDGIWQNSQPFVDALVRLGFMTHARMLRQGVRLGADRLDWDDQARECCEDEIQKIADMHLNGDGTEFERAVFEFWNQTEP